jgi:hypothetical protein
MVSCGPGFIANRRFADATLRREVALVRFMLLTQLTVGREVAAPYGTAYLRTFGTRHTTMTVGDQRGARDEDHLRL